MEFDDKRKSFNTEKERDEYAVTLMPQKPVSLGFCPKIQYDCRLDCIAYVPSHIHRYGSGVYYARVHPSCCGYSDIFCSPTEV